MLSKNLGQKILLSLFLIVLLGLYFKAFFTTGVYFDDIFLKKEVVSSDTYYKGKNRFGRIQITVKGQLNKNNSADVLYSFPNNINKQYTVTFKAAKDWTLGIENIKDEDGKIIFEGEYQKGSYFLFDKNGEPFMDDTINVFIEGQNPYTEEYRVPLKNVADFALFGVESIRGKYEFLIMAILIFLYTALDIKYPLFLFNLKNGLSVKDPEPSDLYLTMQKFSWYASPVIGIFLMIAALNYFNV